MATHYVLLDRDGTLVRDEGYTHRVEDYALLPGVLDGLRTLSGAGFRFAIVTNQSGIGRGYYDEATFLRFQHHLCTDLASAGIVIEASFHCPHTPDEGCGCRKPAPGLLYQARDALELDLAQCWMIGDSSRDIGAAQAAGCAGAVLVTTGEGEAAAERVSASVPRAADLEAAARRILETLPGNDDG